MMLESPEDMARTCAVAEEYGRRHDCKVHVFSISPTYVDAFAWRGSTLVAVAEVKSRPYQSGKYVDQWLTLRKWDALTHMSRACHVPGIYVLGWTDAIGCVDVATVDASRVEINGRYDRGLPNDFEPMILVPRVRFEMFERGPWRTK